jgi:hypothetical protein
MKLIYQIRMTTCWMIRLWKITWIKSILKTKEEKETRYEKAILFAGIYNRHRFGQSAGRTGFCQ